MFKKLFFYVLLWLPFSSFSQGKRSFYNGLYQVYQQTYENVDFQVYQFSRKGVRMKAKYFAQNAYQQYQNWKSNKRILFVCAGAFSSKMKPGSPPVGICVDNGVIVQKTLDYTMDGLVVVYNGGAQQGGVGIVNMENEPLTARQGFDDPKEFWPRNSNSDKIQLLQWGSQQGLTVFQTQLMYSRSAGFGFPANKERYGNTANRRFLAICSREGEVFHLVINMPRANHLNYSSKLAKNMLENNGFTIYGLLNLDTGGKDIMLAFDDRSNLIAQAPVDLREATNLLAYYVD